MTDLPISIAIAALILVLVVLEFFRRRDIRARRRLRELKTEIETMKWEISSLEKLKSELLTRIGSSLRQPLTSVRESALELTRPLDSSPEMNTQMSRLTAEIDEIEHFLNVLSEIAMLEDLEESSNGTPPLGGMENPLIRIDQLVSDILQDNIHRMTEYGLSLTVAMDDNLLVRGNEKYIVHAVSNLINEAMRQISRGGIVNVNLSRTADSIRLKINTRGEPRSEEGNSALGVELARLIISTHGGWLTEGRGIGEYTANLPPALSDEVNTG